MPHHRASARRLLTVALLSLLVLPLSGGRVDAAAAGPDHLEWARRLIAGVTPETNAYASRPTVVTWSGVSGAAETRNRSVCSALVAHLMMQAYGYRPADFATIRDAGALYFGPNPPTVTLLGVQSLGREGALVAVGATAITGASGFARGSPRERER